MEITIERVRNFGSKSNEIKVVYSGVIVGVVYNEKGEGKFFQSFCKGEIFGLDGFGYKFGVLDYFSIGHTNIHTISAQLLFFLLKEDDLRKMFITQMRVLLSEVAAMRKSTDEELILYNLRKIKERSDTLKGLPAVFLRKYTSDELINKLEAEGKIIIEDGLVKIAE